MIENVQDRDNTIMACFSEKIIIWTHCSWSPISIKKTDYLWNEAKLKKWLFHSLKSSRRKYLTGWIVGCNVITFAPPSKSFIQPNHSKIWQFHRSNISPHGFSDQGAVIFQVYFCSRDSLFLLCWSGFKNSVFRWWFSLRKGLFPPFCID
jgi:hypothetical protein